MSYRGRSPIHRNPGAISREWQSIKRSTVTWGHDYNRTSGGSFNRHSGSIILFCPFYLTAIKWDFYAAGDYKIAIVNNLTNSPTDIYVINAAYTAVGSHAEETITLSTPQILLPGVRYFFSVLKSGASAKIDDRNSPVLNMYSTYLWYYDASYNGSYTGDFTIPMKLVGIASISSQKW